MTSSMQPAGLFGSCALCYRTIATQTPIRTVFLGVPKSPYLAHESCALKWVAAMIDDGSLAPAEEVQVVAGPPAVEPVSEVTDKPEPQIPAEDSAPRRGRPVKKP